jgi:hypothetical protein
MSPPLSTSLALRECMGTGNAKVRDSAKSHGQRVLDAVSARTVRTSPEGPEGNLWPVVAVSSREARPPDALLRSEMIRRSRLRPVV